MPLFRVLVLLLLNVQLAAQTQRFALPPLQDSSSWSTQLPRLAKEVVQSFNAPDGIDLLDNQFRLHLAAEQFDAALLSIQQMRKKYAELEGVPQDYVGIQFEIYARLKLLPHWAPGNQLLFDSVFNRLYAPLPERDKPRADNYFGQKPATSYANFKRALEQALKKSNDSISLKDAVGLLRAYASWQTYSTVSAPGQTFIAAYESKHYEGIDSMLVKTSTGGELAVFVYRGKTWVNDKRPAILVLNIYASNANDDKSWAKEIAGRGYVGVIANARGKRNSSNTIQPFEWESKDGYDIIQWITEQPWSDGRVGMYGGSYLGFAQWATTKKLHPALKTIVPQVAVGAGIDFPFYNGITYSYGLTWARYVTSNKHTNQREFGDTSLWNRLALRWYKGGYRFRDLDSLLGKRNTVWQTWLDHPTRDSYWQQMIPVGEEFKRINIPVLTITGYFDSDQHGAMHYLREHFNHLPNANHHLLIGPYDHPGAQGRPAKILRGYAIDSIAQLDIENIVFEWFDHIFYQKPKPRLLQQKINYQIPGTNRWAHSTTWRSFLPQSTPLFIGEKTDSICYRLTTKPASKKDFIEMEVDYTKRDYVTEFDPMEQLINRKLETYHSLVWEYTPTPQQSIFSGYWNGQVDISINKKDVDLVFVLYEQRKDSTYFPLSSHLVRASLAKNPAKRELLQPHQITSIPINFPTLLVKKLEPGSKLVLTAGVNMSPWHQVNYGTGKDVSDESISDANEPLRIRWYKSSFVRFPLK